MRILETCSINPEALPESQLTSSSNSATTMSSTTTATNTAMHIFVFPFPALGHMLPLLDLTHQLALRGLKITILVTPKNLPILNPLQSTHPSSIQTLVLPFPAHPILPSGVENVKDIGNSGNAPIIAALSELEDEVMQWFRSHPCPPQAILFEFFLGFTQCWAEKLNIPSISFFSAGAFVSCQLFHLLQNIDSVHSSEVFEFSSLPRSPTFIKEHLPSIVRKYTKDNLDSIIVKESLLANCKSWGIVFNSFHALEGEYLDHMKQLGQGRVYGVGPLSSIGRHNPGSDVGKRVLKWLDDCPDESVLYVCFGSQKLLTESQMEALALGLEKSETRFLWVVKSGAEQYIPDGFEEHTVNRGLVVKGWAPQVEILNHKAVCGFVSHCGWNSTLESIMAGVMLLAWPMEADQFANARLLVEYMGLAIKFCEGEDTVPDPDELACIINHSLGANIPQRDRAEVMRDKAIEGVKSGGSSFTTLDELVTDLSRIGVPNISQ